MKCTMIVYIDCFLHVRQSPVDLLNAWDPSYSRCQIMRNWTETDDMLQGGNVTKDKPRAVSEHNKSMYSI